MKEKKLCKKTDVDCGDAALGVGICGKGFAKRLMWRNQWKTN